MLLKQDKNGDLTNTPMNGVLGTNVTKTCMNNTNRSVDYLFGTYNEFEVSLKV